MGQAFTLFQPIYSDVCAYVTCGCVCVGVYVWVCAGVHVTACLSLSGHGVSFTMRATA